ncbi:MAG: DUF928 domain-containing protein, partial [Myxococcota bacterium]
PEPTLPEPEPAPTPTVVAQPKTPAPAPTAKPPAATTPPAKREVPEPSPPEAPPRPIQVAAVVPKDVPMYAPGALANTAAVRLDGEARSLGAAAPTPQALGPLHVGASSRESPNLYWFLPEATASPVEVTITSPDAVAPLLEMTVPGPLEAGVHRVSLAEHRVRLDPGTDYRWFVALVRDPERRSQDVVSVAGIRYTPASAELSARLAAAPLGSTAHLYAESGLWYDAFDQLSSWLAAERGSATLRDHRAALLDQVGLDQAAAFERAAAE